MWIEVGRWEKDNDRREEILDQVGVTLHRWRELAMDVGLNPETNVILEENATEIRVGISAEMQSCYRGVPKDSPTF